MINNSPASGCTRWPGTPCPMNKMLDHFRQSDVFMQRCEITATGDRDGFSNLFAEAMTLGVPVVRTEVSAIPELVIHEKTGLLVKPKQSEVLEDTY